MVLCKDVPDDLFCLDVYGRCVVGLADAGVVQQMVFSLLFCLYDDSHVEDVEVVDVPQMYDPDEPLHVDYDVKVDG